MLLKIYFLDSEDEDWDDASGVQNPSFALTAARPGQILCPFCITYKSFAKTPNLIQHIEAVHGSWTLKEHNRVQAQAEWDNTSFGKAFSQLCGEVAFGQLASRRGHKFQRCAVGDSVRWTPAEI